ncbi:MAG: hypothetical protein HFH08_01985 [Bacilli bacterium]|nr:hypothetical protein [Bacilli bacterium]
METKRQYFSLVSDRITSLKEKLETVRKNLSEISEKEKRRIVSTKLEIEFLEYKIEYLEKIKDLPFYIVISELSSEQLREIREAIGKLGLSLEETRAYLMEKLNLHDIPSLIKHSDISCLSQIDNYETIMNLITIQKRNGNYAQQKRDLQRELEIPEELCVPTSYQVFEQSGKTRPLCYYEIGYIKKRLSIYAEKLKQVMETFDREYRGNVIEEIASYFNRSNDDKLSREFIRKHAKKVLTHFPEEKSSIKYLLQSEKNMGFLTSFFIKKRRKKEQAFLDCVLMWYQKDDTLSFFGLDNRNLFTLSKEKFCELTAKIQQEAQRKQEKIDILSSSIRVKEGQILNTVRDYNILQEDAKTNFSRIIYSNIPNFQSAWLHWLWQVPSLLEVLMKGHTLAEVETLVECLKEPFPYYKNGELVEKIVYMLSEKRRN